MEILVEIVLEIVLEILSDYGGNRKWQLQLSLQQAVEAE